MATTVNSVLGPVSTADLGFTLMHEHVVTGSAGIWETYPEILGGVEDLPALAVAALEEARRGGVRTIVDLTTMDLGRNIRFLAQVARESGVTIIAATGAWRDIPRAFWERTPDEVAALFIREIEVGIENTGIKAGIIKVANDAEGVTPAGEIVLRAAARAAKATGTRIATHSYAPGRVGEQQVAIFEDEGLDLSHVIIGHSNDTTDLDYLVGLARRGCYLGMDRFPGRIGPGWEERTETVRRLIEAGWADRIILAHDWQVVGGHASPDRQITRRRNPDGYLFITRRVLPRLREAGIPEEVLTRIMVDNPRRFFEG
ncbi:MAG: amidohydrolase family protein [Actinomycetia bacterium]|nr:amidohydrolase family protein [Actinomycetes bacterium]